MIRVSRRMVQAVLVFGALGCAAPEPGRLVLEESADALRALGNGTYLFDYEGTGSLTGRYRGRTSFERPPDGGFYFKVELLPSPSAPASAWDEEDPPSLTIASNGEEITTRDAALRRFSHGTYRGGSGHLAAGAGYGLLFQFAENDPYSIELGGQVDYVGQDTISGVAVEVVTARSPQLGGSEITWYIGVDDRLPRGRDWLASNEGSEGTFRFRLTELEVDTALMPDALGTASDFDDEIVNEDTRVVSVGEPAPEWSVELADGNFGSANLDQRAVILQVWASWCATCRTAMTELDRMFGAVDGVRLIGLNAWESDTVDPVAWAADFGVSHEVAARGERVAAAFKVAAPPAVFVIGSDGTLLYAANPVRVAAPTLAAEIRAAIRGATD